jgi:hypothetical protein
MTENEYIDKDESATSVKPKAKSKPVNSKRRNAFVQILNGEFLTKEFVLDNLNFIFFIIFMLLLLVGKGYYGKQLSRDVEDSQKELNEMTADYVESKAKLEEDTRRVKLIEKLGPYGLKETVNPTKVIRIKKEDN